ncbi:hypothetical protein [Streptomyces sp. NPDC020742]|uniref:hypothetical protein n=1 Tax=unclassified Streptomyces TaxID=2593676 RepID=UPI0033DED3EB
MGWTILYIAFGLVAVWLLGEVLLQYKARLRWRLLAFAGFLAVVVGVVIPSVIVIGLGLIAFAFGQTQVTLSFRKGFTTGWAIGGRGGENRAEGGGENRGEGRRGEGRRGEGRRGRGRRSAPPAAEPTLEVSDLEAVPAPEAPASGPARPLDNGPDTFESTGGFGSLAGLQNKDAGRQPSTEQEAFAAQETYVGQGSYDYRSDDYTTGGYGTAGGYPAQDPYQDPQDQSVFATQAFPAPSYDDTVYAPQPMPDETGQYGIYSSDARPAPGGYPGYDAYGGTGDGSANGYAYDGSYGGPANGQDPYAADPYAAYGDGMGQGQQTGYSDPYGGAQQYAASYDPYAQPDPYAQADPYAQPDPYAQSYGAQQYGGQGQQPGQGYGETTADGAWVPQQRDHDLPPEQQPYPPYQQQGYDGQQYRY